MLTKEDFHLAHEIGQHKANCNERLCKFNCITSCAVLQAKKHVQKENTIIFMLSDKTLCRKWHFYMSTWIFVKGLGKYSHEDEFQVEEKMLMKGKTVQICL